uniref:Delphilin n=1 Tax=Ciona savignyi TaxID=51511 RepID=H2Y8Z1_CIOSA
SHRSVRVERGFRSFGLTLCGHAPVCIQSVDEGSPAFEAGLKDGDYILALNGIDLRNVDHAKAVALIQGSGSMPTLVIQSSTAAKASSLKKRDDGFNYLLSPTDGRDRHDWASNYVPDCFTVKGRTFKDYVLGYLSAVDAHTLKSAIEQFYSFRNLDVFIIQIYPIVDSIPAGGQQILAFLQYLMTSEEREKFKIKLTDLANFNVAGGQRPSFNRTTPETSKANLQRAESFGAHDAHSKPVDDSGYREQSSINNMPDELRQKKGYLSSIKKRLTFSRPPKNTDTDTFLNELSAQFDEAMNLIDDIELSEEDEKIKYGEKWSYVPKNELETTRQEAPVEPAQETVSLTEPPSPSSISKVEELSAPTFSPPAPCISAPATARTNPAEEVIYDVPRPVNHTQTLRRPHINVERRTRRSRANRPLSMSAKRNSAEVRMHKRNYRVSGISMNMEDIFSEAEDDLHAAPPQNSPPTPKELEQNVVIGDPDEVYAPLHEEVLALGLAYDENENEEVEEEDQKPKPVPTIDSQGLTGIPPAPPLPPPLMEPPPPPPLSPPMMFKNSPNDTPARMSVKRINWEKIEPDYDTINDVVKYLDLEQHFAMKKAKTFSKCNYPPVKKDVISILAHKKAYNTSILLAHLKLTTTEITNCLLINGSEATRKKLVSSHYQQLLLYAPDEEEAEKLKNFAGDISKLNEADTLSLKLVNIPGYQLRLKALVFKHSFAEKEEEIRRNLEVVQRASNQLRKSRKLAKILEFVLAMGNYMNQGHIRISKATGFRIHFLAEMDCTKTSDNKMTFLHILARAVSSKFPEVLSFADELTDVKDASRGRPNQRTRQTDLSESYATPKQCLKKNTLYPRIIAMETCLVRTNGAIKRLEQLHQSTSKEFNKVAQYFGENPKNIGMQQFFNIFEEFIRKFQ